RDSRTEGSGRRSRIHPDAHQPRTGHQDSQADEPGRADDLFDTQGGCGARPAVVRRPTAPRADPGARAVDTTKMPFRKLAPRSQAFLAGMIHTFDDIWTLTRRASEGIRLLK